MQNLLDHPQQSLLTYLILDFIFVMTKKERALLCKSFFLYFFWLAKLDK